LYSTIRFGVHSGFVHENVRAGRDVVRNTPRVFQALHGELVDHQPPRREVTHGYLSRIGAANDVHRQFSGEFADFMKIRPEIENRAALGIAGRNTENRNARFFRRAQDRVQGRKDGIVSRHPQSLGPP